MHPHPDDHRNAKAVHNMALVGEHRIFLSHLPMFMPPHDAQVIAEATFVKDGKNVDDVFCRSGENPDIRFYTVQPESFAIQELFQPDPMHSRRTQFLNLNITVQAELYFEEGELSSTKMSGKLFEQTKEEEKAGFE